MLHTKSLLFAALGSLFVTSVSQVALAQSAQTLDTSAPQRIRLVVPQGAATKGGQNTAQLKGVEPWNPNIDLLIPHCSRVVEMNEQNVSKDSPDYAAASADCNDLIMGLIAQSLANGNGCDPQLTDMAKRQVLPSRNGELKFYVTDRSSDAARAGLQCLGEKP